MYPASHSVCWDRFQSSAALHRIKWVPQIDRRNLIIPNWIRWQMIQRPEMSVLFLKGYKQKWKEEKKSKRKRVEEAIWQHDNVGVPGIPSRPCVLSLGCQEGPGRPATLFLLAGPSAQSWQGRSQFCRHSCPEKHRRREENIYLDVMVTITYCSIKLVFLCGHWLTLPHFLYAVSVQTTRTTQIQVIIVLKCK